MTAKGDVVEIDPVPAWLDELNQTALRLYITGADTPVYQAWQESDTVFVQEVMHADGTVDRWENGIPVMPALQVLTP